MRDELEEGRARASAAPLERPLAPAPPSEADAITDVGAWDFDPSRAPRWDARCKAMFGLRPEVEPTYEAFLAAVHPGDRARVERAIAAAMDPSGPFVCRVEFRVIGVEDKVTRTLSARGRGLVGEGGRPERFVGTIVDVTAEREGAASERARAAAALERAELRYQLATRATRDAIGDWDLSVAQFRVITEAMPQLVWTTRADGYHEYYNQRWYDYTGMSPEETAGEGWRKAFHPDDLVATEPRWRHSLTTGEPYETEYRCRRYDGEYRWFLGRALPVRGEDGRILQWFGTCTDIHDQKHLELERLELLRRVEASRHHFSALVENLPALAWTAQPDGFVDYYNRRWFEYTGTTLEEMQGWGWEKVHDPEMLGEVMARWRRSLATGEPFEMEFPLRGADGALRWFLTRIQPLRDESGQIARWFGTSTNIDDQRKAAAELRRFAAALEQSNKELDQFAYVASHDLKAPLRGIANLSEWIEEDLGAALSPSGREQMTLLRGRVHRLEALIEGILNYSRAGRTRSEPERVEVGKLVAEVVELLAPPPGVLVSVDPGAPALVTERVPLQQVFMNLIGNAIKHAAGDAARVRISARDAGALWEFSVADDGPGIAPAYHERIWGIFQTLKSRDTLESTGIGLSVVRKIVEAKGGKAWVESQEGQGATFFFTWPRGADPLTSP